MADLTRQTRLRLMSKFINKAKADGICNIKGLREAYDPVLKEFSDLSLRDFRESLFVHEQKIRGNLKRMDLNVFVGSSKVSEKEELSETAREVFRKFAETHRCGDVWVETIVVEALSSEVPHGMSDIIQGAITMMWNVSNAQNAAKKLDKDGLEDAKVQDQGYKRKTQWYVGHCRGFIDLQNNIDDQVRRMIGPDAFQLEVLCVAVTRGDIMPAFEIAFGQTVHAPIMRVPYVSKTDAAKHELYKRNEVEYLSFIERNTTVADGTELERCEVITERMVHTLDIYAGALSSAIGTLNLRSGLSLPPRDDIEGSTKTELPNFSGKWWIEKSEGLDEYLKAMGMGRIKRGIITAKASFTQDIKQVRNMITMKFVSLDDKRSNIIGPFELGSYDVVKIIDLVGDEVMLGTKWNGSTLVETQKGPRGTAECSRYLVHKDEDSKGGESSKMVLEYMFEGTFMKQTYKKVGVTTLK